jgi:hypothetical protein
MTARRVTDAMLLGALVLLGQRFTVRELRAALKAVGVTAFTQARYWLLRDHGPSQPALLCMSGRIHLGTRGRPQVLYEVTEYGQSRIRRRSRDPVAVGG